MADKAPGKIELTKEEQMAKLLAVFAQLTVNDVWSRVKEGDFTVKQFA